MVNGATELQVTDHIHSWSYATTTVDGQQVIAAYCTNTYDKCAYYGTASDLSQALTASVKAGTKTYDGSPCSVSVNGSGTDILITNPITDVTGQAIDISYTGLNGTTYDSTTPPTDVGYYRVTLTLSISGEEDRTAYADFIIKDGNALVTTAPESQTLTYNGQSQQLISPGSAENGTLYYQQTDGSWSTELPTAVNAGTYTVSYYIVGSGTTLDNGSESDPIDTVTTVIRKKNLEKSMVVPSYTHVDFDYKKHHPSLELQDISQGQNLLTEEDYQVYNDGLQQEVGTYTITVQATEAGNYTGTVELTWQIDSLGEAKVSDVPEKLSLVYDGSQQDLVQAGSSLHGTVYYRLEDSILSTPLASLNDVIPNQWSTDIPSGLDAGVYKVDYYIKADNGYQDMGSETSPWGVITTTIARKPLTEEMVQLEYSEIDYDGNNHLPQVYVSDVNENGKLLTDSDYTIEQATAQSQSGTYKILVKATEEGNYSGQVTVEWKIKAEQVAANEETALNQDVTSGQTQPNIPRKIYSAITGEKAMAIYPVVICILAGLVLIYIDQRIYRNK